MVAILIKVTKLCYDANVSHETCVQWLINRSQKSTINTMKFVATNVEAIKELTIFPTYLLIQKSYCKSHINSSNFLLTVGNSQTFDQLYFSSQLIENYLNMKYIYMER